MTTLSGPQPFAGDMFGVPEDYLGDNFGQANGEEEEEEEHVDLEADWEPECPGAHGASAAASGDFDQAHTKEHAGHELMPNGPHRQVESHITENFFVVCYSDKYPHRRAGAAVQQKQPSDMKYCADLDSSSNLWAPFSSQLDWEIAKWAKLHGAGSIAFLDLLAIEGVSDIYRIIYVHSSSFFHRFVTHLTFLTRIRTSSTKLLIKSFLATPPSNAAKLSSPTKPSNYSRIIS
jgi:hypothetical protein